MAPILIQLDFRGTVTPLFPGVLLVRAHAKDGTFADAGEAFLESRLSFVGERGFDVAGTIGFGDGTALRFRSIGLGVIGETDGPRLRSGASICEVDSCSGAFEGVRGRITSNFVLSDTGELTDRHVGLLFPAEVVAR